MSVLTRRELDRRRCADPACPKDHGEPSALEVFPICCAGRGEKNWRIVYDQVVGTLILRCPRCGALGARIGVADGCDA